MVAPTPTTPAPPIAAAAKIVSVVSAASIVRSSPARTIAPFSIKAWVLFLERLDDFASNVLPIWPWAELLSSIAVVSSAKSNPVAA